MLKFIFSKDSTMIDPLIHGGKKRSHILKESCSYNLTAACLLIPPYIRMKELKRRHFV